jgi:hypothetical protein
MSRKRFDDMPCSIARALNMVGDWWTLPHHPRGVPRRDSVRGLPRAPRHRAQHSLGSTAEARAEDILAKQPKGAARVRVSPDREKAATCGACSRRFVLWGDKWIYGPGKEPLIVRDRERGAVVTQLLPADAEGNLLDPRRLVAIAGPGTSPEVAERYRATARKKHSPTKETPRTRDSCR